MQCFFVRRRSQFMSKSKKPEVVSLTNEEVQSLKKRVEESSLLASDQKILLGLLYPLDIAG